MTEVKGFFRRPETFWWMGIGLLAILIVLLLARRLLG
jgi:hypothetical protein